MRVGSTKEAQDYEGNPFRNAVGDRALFWSMRAWRRGASGSLVLCLHAAEEVGDQRHEACVLADERAYPRSVDALTPDRLTWLHGMRVVLTSSCPTWFIWLS